MQVIVCKHHVYLRHCPAATNCREADMQPSFDLDVAIQRLRILREKHSEVKAIPEAPRKRQCRELQQGKRQNPRTRPS